MDEIAENTKEIAKVTILRFESSAMDIRMINPPEMVNPFDEINPCITGITATRMQEMQENFFSRLGLPPKTKMSICRGCKYYYPHLNLNCAVHPDGPTSSTECRDKEAE